MKKKLLVVISCICILFCFASLVGCSSKNDKGFSLPKGATEITMKQFAHREDITAVEVPDSVKTIDSGAFDGCVNLTTVVIPDSVTSIGHMAFIGCKNLKTIKIGSGITSFGTSVFEECTSLESITYNGTKEQWNAIEKGSDWNAYTGNYVVNCTDGTIEKNQ